MFNYQKLYIVIGFRVILICSILQFQLEMVLKRSKVAGILFMLWRFKYVIKGL